MRPIERRTSSSVNDLGQGVVGATAWKTTLPGSQPRLVTVIRTANAIRSARIWSSIAQPITRREQLSQAAYSYSQPALVSRR